MSILASAKAFLGIDYGTARARLTKLIMYDQARRLNMLNCYRCGQHIDDVNDFTIDHKQHWLRVSVELFYDMDNIAFSHHSCNSRHCRRGKNMGD